MNAIKKISFDESHDVLYLTFRDKTNSYGDEDENGVVTLKNWDTDVITGMIIMDFNKKLKDKSIYSILNRH